MLWILVIIAIWSDPSINNTRTEYGSYSSREICEEEGKAISDTFSRGRGQKPTNIIIECNYVVEI